MLLYYLIGYVVFATIGCIIALRQADEVGESCLFCFWALLLSLGWPVFAIPSLAWLINKGLLPE